MSINYSLKKLLAVGLAAAAVAVAVLVGAQGAFAGGSGKSTSAAQNSNAMPPILAPQSASQLAALEAWEAVEFRSDPPASAPYSNAEMNAYGTTHK
jgi:hypothetical protein